MIMKKTNYKLNSKNYLKSFKQARTDRADKLASLPFARKIDILEKLQADHKVIHSSIRTLK